MLLRLEWVFGPFLGLGALALGVVSLVGAWLGNPWLGVESIGGAPMAPITSLLVGGAGVAVVLASMRRGGQVLSRAAALVVGVASVAILAEYFFGVDLWLERVAGPAWDPQSPHPGRPSPYTALALVCLTLSVLVLREYGVVRRRFGWLSPLLASLAMAVGVTASLGYADYLHLPSGGGPNIAPAAALGILLAGAGVLAVGAHRSRLVLHGDGAPGAWLPAWIGGPVGALVFSGTLSAWVVIMHLSPGQQPGAGALEISRASLAIVVIGGALGVVSGAAAALLARSRVQVRRMRVWADSLAATQVRLRALFQQAAVGIELLSPEGRMLEVNDKLCEILGTTRQRLLGKNFRDITFAGDLPAEERMLSRLLDRQAPSYVVEKRYVDAEGRPVWVRVTSSLAVDRHGRAMYRISIVEDISMRKRAEEALRDSESRKSAMLESALDAVISMDHQGRIIEFNPAAEEMFGYARSRALGRPAEELLIPERLRGTQILGRPAGTDAGRRVETPVTRADGSEFPAEISMSETVVHGGQPVLTVFVRDVTEQLRSEAAAAQLASVVASSDDAIMSIDLNGNIRTFNRGAERLYGYAAGEVLGRPVTTLIPEERRAEEEQILARIGRGEPVEHHETVRLTKDGRRISVSLTVSPIRDGTGRITGASKIARDIGDRIRAEAARAQLAAIVASSEDAIISKDLDGVITSFNAGAERLFGYTAEEVIGRSIRILIPPDRLDEEDMILGKIRRGEPVHHYETVRLKKNGELLDISLTVSPMRDSAGRIVGASKIARDVTQRRRVEAELNSYREDLERQVQARTAELERSQGRLRSSERLAALGTLSAGLGHDMGNLLLPIRMRLQALEAEPLPDHVRDDLQAIAASAVYLQRLATSLRLFAMDPGEDGGEGSRAVSEGAELNQWWRDTEPLLRAALPRGVFLDVSPSPGRPDAGPFPAVRVTIAPQRLMQAVFNLVQNAAEAIHDSGKQRGWVRIGAELIEESRVRLFVEDNGPGMTPEVLRRCMEPFFSTKTRRISTGMGLSMVRGYIEQSGGRIDVSSELGVGTLFVLVLPVLAGAPEQGDALRQRCRAAVTMQDPRARALVEWSLKSLGAEVKPIENGAPNRQEAQVWVLDSRAASASAIEEFTKENGGEGSHLAVVCGMEPPDGAPRMSNDKVLYTGECASPAAIRKTLERAVEAACRR
jgi:PAS domain S-box-containing protein